MKILVPIILAAMILPGCSSSGGAGSVASAAGSKQSGYDAGLREPRALRGPRGPRPYAGGASRAGNPMAAAQGQSTATYNPASKGGSLRIDRTTYSWDQSTRTLHLNSGIPSPTVPHSQASGGILPQVHYDPITDSWSWR